MIRAALFGTAILLAYGLACVLCRAYDIAYFQNHRL